MKYLLIANEDGLYQGKNGKKYDLLECNNAVGPRAAEFVDFANLKKAKEYYGLTEIEA